MLFYVLQFCPFASFFFSYVSSWSSFHYSLKSDIEGQEIDLLYVFVLLDEAFGFSQIDSSYMPYSDKIKNERSMLSFQLQDLLR